MKKHKYLILTLIWMIVIFFFSAQNGDDSSKNNMFIAGILEFIGLEKFISQDNINFIIRKGAHFSEYFILGILLYRTLKEYLFSYVKIFSIITGFVYACSDEFHQYFVPGRGPAIKDVLIDTCGVVIGVLLFTLIGKIKTQKQHKRFTSMGGFVR